MSENQKEDQKELELESTLDIIGVEGKWKRWYGLDILRGVGLFGVIFIHGIIQNYAGLDEIDLNNLPPLFMVLYIITFWGGLYVLISGTVNIYRIYQHYTQISPPKKACSINGALDFSYEIRYLFKYGIILLIVHFLFNFALGPTFHDFETKIHKYSLIPGMLHEGWGYQVSIDRIVTGSSLSTIALSLIFLGILSFLLMRKNPQKHLKRNKSIFLILGFVVVLLGFFQIPLYHLYEELMSNQSYFLGILLSYIGGEPFPLFPYFGYGCIGAYFGLVLVNCKNRKTILRQLWLILPFIIIGIVAFMVPNALYERFGLLDDIFMSYIMLNFNVGLFISFLIIAIAVADFSSLKSKWIESEKPSKFVLFTIAVGKQTLVIYLLETPIREIFAFILSQIIPNWNTSIPACILFGVGLIAFWVSVVSLLNRKKIFIPNKWWNEKLFTRK